MLLPPMTACRRRRKEEGEGEGRIASRFAIGKRISKWPSSSSSSSLLALSSPRGGGVLVAGVLVVLAGILLVATLVLPLPLAAAAIHHHHHQLHQKGPAAMMIGAFGRRQAVLAGGRCGVAARPHRYHHHHHHGLKRRTRNKNRSSYRCNSTSSCLHSHRPGRRRQQHGSVIGEGRRRGDGLPLSASPSSSSSAPCFLGVLGATSHRHFRQLRLFQSSPAPPSPSSSCLFLSTPAASPSQHEDQRQREDAPPFADAAPASTATTDLTLRELENEIAELNGGFRLNVNSPKQVSLAVFGCVRSTNRTALLEVVAQGGGGDDEVENLGGSGDDADAPSTAARRRRRIAELVLRHRELSSGSRVGQPSSSPSLSTAAAARHINTAGAGQQQIAVGADASKGQDAYPVVADVNDGYDDGDDYLSSFDRHVESLFAGDSKTSGNKIHGYWKEPLLQLTRPTARSLVYQLDSTMCPMGFNPLALPRDPYRGREATNGGDGSTATTTTTTTTAGKKGSFLAYCREQKEKYPDSIVLTRCGDFYEAYGIDAIMLVEHCGLNAMASKAKAGCPIRNIQQTLDCLTSAGFRVAVYEEASDTDALSVRASGGSKSRIKNRFLAQIVSSAAPTYLYDLVLLAGSSAADALASAPPSRPHVGVLSLQSGYTLVEISVEEQSVRVSERLTAEGVSCRLAAYPPADPLFYVPSAAEYESSTDGAYSLPFLPSRRESSAELGPGCRLRTKVIPPTLLQDPRPGVSDIERAKNTVLSALLRLIDCHRDGNDNDHQKITVDDFVLLKSSMTDDATKTNSTQTHPLYLETATQLGLMNDHAIPSLVSYLLPNSAPAATRRFLRRFLLTPPPPAVADSMRELVRFLKDGTSSAAVPPLSVPPVGKVLALLRAGQASAEVYGDVLSALLGTILVLEQYDGCGGDSSSVFVESLMTLLEHESGMAADAESLRQRCIEAIEAIEDVVSPVHHARAFSGDDYASSCWDHTTNFGNVIPEAFFERNEAPWRGRVRREASPDTYDRVDTAARNLAAAVSADFWGTPELSEATERSSLIFESKNPIVQDIFNNLFALREVPKHVDDKNAKSTFIHPRDRFGKVLRNRYTTERVQDALSDYVDACDSAKKDVSSVLQSLSQRLHDQGHIPAIVQSSHSNLILSSAMYHAAKARSLGWNLAETYEPDPAVDSAGYFSGVWPYWMDRSDAVVNSFELKGMWLLTAPNMAGKSTILRSTAAAALLSASGLCAPVGPESKVRKFDHIFVRGASSDVPSEQKSAFGAEMGDVAALLRCCNSKSLVFVDELGRGTSPRDGTRLAAAVLEEMAHTGMSGIFATHLHEILDLPLKGRDRIYKKRMAIHEQDSTGQEMDQYTWTYRLEDGVCTDSMALVTALRFGLPQRILDRAEALSVLLPPTGTSSELPFKSKEAVNGDSLQRIENKGFPAPTSHRLLQIVQDLTDQRVLSIPPRWMVPPSLEGESCVYVIQLDGNDNAQKCYVGETDNLRQRLQSHRSKGADWSRAPTIAVAVPGGKSDARSLESRLIQHLARNGFHLESIWDGRSIRGKRT